MVDRGHDKFSIISRTENSRAGITATQTDGRLYRVSQVSRKRPSSSARLEFLDFGRDLNIGASLKRDNERLARREYKRGEPYSEHCIVQFADAHKPSLSPLKRHEIESKLIYPYKYRELSEQMHFIWKYNNNIKKHKIVTLVGLDITLTTAWEKGARKV